MTSIPKRTALTVLSEEMRLHPETGYAAYFLEDVDDATVLISIPTMDNTTWEPPQWSLLTIHYEVNAVRYIFCAQVLRKREDGTALFVRLTTGLMRAQRRGDIRLEILQEMTGVTIVTDANVEPQHFTGTAMDISAGGLCLRTNADLRPGDQFKITLPMMADTSITDVRCDICWKVRLPDDAPYKFSIGCTFSFPYRVDKDRLLLYINKMQRMRLEKIKLDVLP